MARILASGAAAAASASLGSSWLFGLCVFVVSVWGVSFAVFICAHSNNGDDRPKKKPAAPAPAKKATRGAARSGTVVDSTGMYVAAYSSATYSGCSGGHHGGGGGCGGGGGGGGCGGGGGGGCGGGC